MGHMSRNAGLANQPFGANFQQRCTPGDAVSSKPQSSIGNGVEQRRVTLTVVLRDGFGRIENRLSIGGVVVESTYLAD